MRRSVGLASVVLTGLLVLSGCGAGSGGGDSPTATKAPQPSGTNASSTATSPASAQSGASASFVCASLSQLNAVTGLQFTLAHQETDACLYDVVTNGSLVLGLVAGWPLAPATGPDTVAAQRATLQGTGLYTIRDAAAFFGSGAFWAATNTTVAVYGPGGKSAYDIQLSIDQPGGLGGLSPYAVVTAAAHLLLRR